MEFDDLLASSKKVERIPVEDAVWDKIRRASLDAHWTRIENSVGVGVPDLYVCRDGREAWVELKVMRQGHFTIRPSQVAWMSSYLAAGGRRAWLAVWENSLRALLLWKGEQLSALISHNIARVDGKKGGLSPNSCKPVPRVVLVSNLAEATCTS